MNAMADIGAGRSAEVRIKELGALFEDLQKLAAEVNNLYRIAMTAEETAQVGKEKPRQKPKLIIPPRRKMTQSERSAFIKQVAAEMVEPNGEVNVRDVATAIATKGVDLGTSVPGTMIGNVLYKSGAWNRVAKGIFRYVQKSLV